MSHAPIQVARCPSHFSGFGDSLFPSSCHPIRHLSESCGADRIARALECPRPHILLSWDQNSGRGSRERPSLYPVPVLYTAPKRHNRSLGSRSRRRPVAHMEPHSPCTDWRRNTTLSPRVRRFSVLSFWDVVSGLRTHLQSYRIAVRSRPRVLRRRTDGYWRSFSHCINSVDAFAALFICSLVLSCTYF